MGIFGSKPSDKQENAISRLGESIVLDSTKVAREREENRAKSSRGRLIKLFKQNPNMVLTVGVRDRVSHRNLLIHDLTDEYVTFIGVDGTLTFGFADIFEVREQDGKKRDYYTQAELEKLANTFQIVRKRRRIESDSDNGSNTYTRGALTITARSDKNYMVSEIHIPGSDLNVLYEDGPWHDYLKSEIDAWHDEAVTWDTEYKAEQKRIELDKKRTAQLEIVREAAKQTQALDAAREAFALAEQSLAEAASEH